MDCSEPETPHLSGRTRGQLEKGALASKTHAEKLLQSACKRPTSSADQRWETHAWGGQTGHQNASRQGKNGRYPRPLHPLESQTSKKGLHSQSQQQVKAARNPRCSGSLPSGNGQERP